MTCKRCGAVATPGSKFCPACGNALPPEPVLQAANPLAATIVATGPLPGYAPPRTPIGAPPQQAQPYVARPTNGLAIASMVLGILWVYWVGSILALVFGYIAKGQINESGGQQGGKGMAIAGIVLGWVGVGTLCLLFVPFLLGAFKP